MTEEERRLEKWKRRAEIFRQAYREAEGEAVNLKMELEFKTAVLEGRIAELEAQLDRKKGDEALSPIPAFSNREPPFA